LGRELPIHAVFDHPVLGDLAKRIGLVTDSTKAFDVLLPIRREGSLPPLFCLHPGTGLCWPYTNLLHATDEHQPLYGIQARGFTGDGPLPGTLEEIVAESLENIRSVQARGRYRLAGWSFGGVIAHMIATRLQREGAQVEHLILLDSYPMPPHLARQADLRKTDEIWREIALGTNLDVSSAGDDVLDAAKIRSMAREQFHLLGTFSVQQLERLVAVMANNARLIPTASLDAFDGDITLFAATRRTPGLDRSGTSPDTWRPFCRGTLRVIEVDAEHHQMLSPDAVRKMAGVLRQMTPG
jgi:thioesterase domain-containing protein